MEAGLSTRDRHERPMTSSASVREFFERDHDRLDQLFASYQRNYASDPAQARRAFAAFRAGLEQHIVWEEARLFPLWEQKTGMTQAGPTVVMRAEHQHIHDLLHRIEAALDPAQDAPREAATNTLVEVLTSHNLKEERILYPAIDQAVSQEARAALIEALQGSAESSASQG